jgi:hypothetical protein
MPNTFYQGSWPTGEYRFFQIAWVVDDVIAAAARWADVYGVGPFHVLPRRKQSVRYRGELTEIELQIAITQSGPVQLELISQTGGDASVYREIYPQGRSGVHHMCTISGAYDETLAHYAAKGYPVIAEVEGGAFRVAYCDTHKDFGFISELVEDNPMFRGQLTAISETCAAWDGQDPVRLLVRGGYRVP